MQIKCHVHNSLSSKMPALVTQLSISYYYKPLLLLYELCTTNLMLLHVPICN